MNSRSGHHDKEPTGRHLWTLSLGALGVVYGDIGTSPLYSMRECFHGPHSVPVTPDNILGVLSLIVWSLLLVVSVKYLVLILRADNHGEGGIMALMALVQDVQPRARRLLIPLGLFGAALLYGDGVITPAISVLSAVEGLSYANAAFARFVLPITVLILIGIFAIQSRGTARVGAYFGPITFVWFLTLAVLGVWHMMAAPQVVRALNPWWAIKFFIDHGFHAFVVLGSVFLVVTGGEALYADMGHFGRKPIRVVWFYLVLPALLLNYGGQGAMLLTNPGAAENPFYNMVPQVIQLPMVALATLATCIASQAVISGAFSLTRQAVQLGYLPRLEIRHTSADEIGQIYIPKVNWLLLIACLWLVFEFKTSSDLAAAYGIAVTTTMVITTILAFFAMRYLWKWNLAVSLGIAGTLVVMDLAFFGANVLKVADGGWFPLALGAFIYTLMGTWRDGRKLLGERLQEQGMDLDKFFEQIDHADHARVSGTAVYMTGNPNGAPPALVNNYRHNHVIHENIIFLKVTTELVPFVSRDTQAYVEKIRDGFWRVDANFGFMQDPNVPALLRRCRSLGLEVDPDQATFVLGRETVLSTERPGLARWREQLFARMSRNSERATAFFRIPSNRVIEIGTQIEL